MSSRCPRSWEVEADVDGRLLSSAKQSLERHEAACEDCRRERAAFERLEQLSEYPADAAGDELALRRLRVRTLEEAARIVDGKSNGLSTRWIFMTALALLLLVGGVSLGRLGTFGSNAAKVAKVTTHGAARWTRGVRDGHEQIVLQSGEINVEHGSEMASLSVLVPDGEIDDIGTVFRVSVSDGQTRRIAVAQGVVVFRRRGDKPSRIEAPDIWYEPAAEPAPVVPPVQAVEEASKPEPEAAATETPVPVKAHHATRQPHVSGATDQAKPEASDIMDEDVAYLRVIALLREGRNDEARLAAQRYLNAFPQGLRRKEIESIAR